MYRCGRTTNPSCSCGFPIENNIHKFLECKKKSTKTDFYNSLKHVQPINLQLLFYGRNMLSDDDNI